MKSHEVFDKSVAELRRISDLGIILGIICRLDEVPGLNDEPALNITFDDEVAESDLNGWSGHFDGMKTDNSHLHSTVEGSLHFVRDLGYHATLIAEMSFDNEQWDEPNVFDNGEFQWRTDQTVRYISSKDNRQISLTDSQIINVTNGLSKAVFVPTNAEIAVLIDDFGINH